MIASKSMNKYFNSLQAGVDSCNAIATVARSMGHDPVEVVDVKLAKNMAERVEGLISTVAPGLMGTGFTKRIMELEEEYSALDWRVALKIAEEVAKQKFCAFKSELEAMEVGIRAGFTYHTGGIVSAPLEGFVELRLKKNKEGKDYLAPAYAGPIRGAGGTAASFSLLLTDYVGTVMGYGKYDPDDKEVARYKAELDDYHERVTNLQYKPTEDEVDFLVRHLPIEIDGEPTEKLEVSNFKDLPRVETNRIRGGVCLVLAEGLSQKAPKLWKRLSVWGKEFGLDWGFLEEFIKVQKRIKAKSKKKQSGLTPNFTFIADLVAGRPVLTHPMAPGGFRLRYGRSRFSGFSAASIHPATMLFLNNFVATGTQLKMERPGKAASITPCDTIDGPIILTNDGSVMRIRDLSQARQYKNQVKEILFLGDIMFNYGDFSENGHVLVPPGYNEDWWSLEAEKAGVKTQVNSARESIELSFKHNIPLHPKYTYFWTSLEVQHLDWLIDWLKKGRLYKGEVQVSLGEDVDRIVLRTGDEKSLLERIGLPHRHVNNEFVVIEGGHAVALLHSLGGCKSHSIGEKSVLENLQLMSGTVIRDKAGTYVGARMGRPEKAKMRKMTGSPQVLFPIGDEGGRLRSFQAAMEAGYVTAELPMYRCEGCGRDTIYKVCEICSAKTTRHYLCSKCGLSEKDTCVHGPKQPYRKQQIDIKHYFSNALDLVGDRIYPDIIKGVRGTSNKDHTPEHLVKGILRAKHEVYVNKDGTVRFDMSELPMTHFKPCEIGTPIQKLRSLGYTHDIHDNELKESSQMVEIMPQDIILPASADAMDEQSDKVLHRVSGFVDELLVKLYKQKPFYNAASHKDLVGHLVIGLAPHISAGTVGRIIGYSRTQGMLCHPLFHAAMRRDCDGDEACVILLMDALLNFSRQYLPDSRGAKTMDAPLVLTSKLNPSEVDDMAHGLDIVWKYPLEFYEAAVAMKNPWQVKVKQIKDVLGTEKQFEGMGYTHDVSDINLGVVCSAYKALPSMEEKLKGQMELAERIRAVDASDVARLVIEKHLLRDTKGNLRKFSMQQFRCVKCNEKFRRPPLSGKCTCGGRLIFTISHGSVIKYLEPTLSLAEKFNVPSYLKQSLELLQLRIDGVFGKEREKQEGLGKWFG